MPTENAELNILYLGNDDPGMESLKLGLLEYFRSPVFIRHARTADEYRALLGGPNIGVIVVEDAPDTNPARRALEMARGLCPGAPFVCLTDAPIVEAAALIRLGAADCVVRGDAAHLRIAVIREIERSIRRGAPTAAEYSERRRAEFVGTLLSLAKNCINVSVRKLQEVIGDAMAMIAGYCDGDRIVSYVLDQEQGTARRHYEWNRLAEFHSDALFQTLDLSDFQDALSVLRQGRLYVGGGSGAPGGIQELGPEGALCAYPVHIGGILRGMIVLSAAGRQKTWSTDEIASFQIFCELLVGMMQRIIEELRHDDESSANALILDALNESVVLFDRDGLVLRANRSFAGRFGRTPEQIANTALEEYMSPDKYSDLIAKRMDALHRTFDSGITTELIDEREGRVYRNRYYPVFDRDSVSAVSMISTEITESVRLQQETLKNAVLNKEAELLREKERELLAILDAGADGSIVVDCSSGMVQYSEKLLRYIGYENLPPETLPDLMGSLIVPEDRAAVARARQEAMRRRDSTLETEFRALLPDGTCRWILGRGRFTYAPNGAPKKYFSIFIDITARKAVEEALRASESRALTLVGELERTKAAMTEEVEALRRLHRISSEHLLQNDLVYFYGEILDAAIEIAHCTKGHIQIYVPKENCLKIITHRGFGDMFLQRFAVVPAGQMPGGVALVRKERVTVRDIEDPLLFTDEEIRLYRAESVCCAQSTPMISSTGTVYGVLSTYNCAPRRLSESELRHMDLLASRAADLIERKRNEVALEISERNATALVEALQRADHSKNEFLNQLSHELRNPLATLNAAISLIGISDDLRQIRETNAILKSEARQMGRLVDDLLDATRIFTNKIKLKTQVMDLREAVAVSAHNFTPRFNARNVRLSVNTGASPVTLKADPARIMQIIENLLTNALKYTDDGGAVVMTLWEDGTNAVISVRGYGHRHPAGGAVSAFRRVLSV